ncbi:MAG TPA: hypothetical protein V6D23_19020, partial [Candidatus Obscuribacterales bacterium]
MDIPALSGDDQKLQEQLLAEKLLTPVQIKQALAAREKAWIQSVDELQGLLCTLSPGSLTLSDFPSGTVRAEIPLRNHPAPVWGDRLVFVDPEDGRLLESVPCPQTPGLLITAEGDSYWLGSDPSALPCLGETLQVQGYGEIDSDLTLSPKGDLLFVSERHNGKLHVVSLVTFKLLTSLKVRESGHSSVINLVVSPEGKRAYLTDQISSRLWMLDLGNWKLSPLQTGLGTLGNLALSADGKFLFLSVTEPQFRMVYFDLQSLSVIQELELQGEPASRKEGAPSDLISMSPDQKRLLFASLAEANGEPCMLVHLIGTRQLRTLRRYPIAGGTRPLALLAGYENPLWELRRKSLGDWLVELGMLQAQALVRLRQAWVQTAPDEVAAPIVYVVPDPDEDPAELLARPAPPITLPPEADEVIVELVARAFYQETQQNLRQHPAEIQKLYQSAVDWRQALEQRYAIQAQAARLLGRFSLQVLITRESLLQEVDWKLEGRELPFRPSHRCPMCQAGLRTPRNCSQCGFHLEDPAWYERREALSAESTSELIPGQLLLALPQTGHLLLLNAWHEIISEYDLKEIGLKEPCHALALPNRNYLICDRKTTRVIELSTGGEVLRQIDHPFVQPLMATFYLHPSEQMRLLIVDRGAHQVLEFDFDGELRCSWGPDSGLDLKEPRDVQRTWDDTLIITDTGNQRVLEVDRSGRILASWGPPQIPLVQPVLARREVNGDTLIVDAGRGQIIAFNPERQLVRNFKYWPPAGQPKLAAEPVPGRILVQQRELIALSPHYWMQIAV